MHASGQQYRFLHGRALPRPKKSFIDVPVTVAPSHDVQWTLQQTRFHSFLDRLDTVHLSLPIRPPHPPPQRIWRTRCSKRPLVLRLQKGSADQPQYCIELGSYYESQRYVLRYFIRSPQTAHQKNIGVIYILFIINFNHILSQYFQPKQYKKIASHTPKTWHPHRQTHAPYCWFPPDTSIKTNDYENIGSAYNFSLQSPKI